MATNKTHFIYYRCKYKYQICKDYLIQTNICPNENVEMDFAFLSTSGLLHIYKGYSFDGPSGPAIDTLNFMRGSLEHDAFYQFMREGKLSPEWRDKVDDRLYETCVEDGMSKIRATWVKFAVKTFAARSSSPQDDRPIYRAPLI